MGTRMGNGKRKSAGEGGGLSEAFVSAVSVSRMLCPLNACTVCNVDEAFTGQPIQTQNPAPSPSLQYVHDARQHSNDRALFRRLDRQSNMYFRSLADDYRIVLAATTICAITAVARAYTLPAWASEKMRLTGSFGGCMQILLEKIYRYW